MTHLTDLLPTFVAAAGGKVDPAWHVDGTNMLAVWTGKAAGAGTNVVLGMAERGLRPTGRAAGPIQAGGHSGRKARIVRCGGRSRRAPRSCRTVSGPDEAITCRALRLGSRPKLAVRVSFASDLYTLHAWRRRPPGQIMSWIEVSSNENAIPDLGCGAAAMSLSSDFDPGRQPEAIAPKATWPSPRPMDSTRRRTKEIQSHPDHPRPAVDATIKTPQGMRFEVQGEVRLDETTSPRKSRLDQLQRGRPAGISANHLRSTSSTATYSRYATAG